MATKEVILEVFWRVYETLKPKERQALAERILRDRKLLEDLGDHVLIERAKQVKGKPVAILGRVRFNQPAV
ncbi:MAG: hypothetical protein U1D67_05345 [Dehalococcoidia bacterium]|nr:hypothetical protein [Dehalococcoidia bacterium]